MKADGKRTGCARQDGRRTAYGGYGLEVFGVMNDCRPLLPHCTLTRLLLDSLVHVFINPQRSHWSISTSSLLLMGGRLLLPLSLASRLLSSHCMPIRRCCRATKYFTAPRAVERCAYQSPEATMFIDLSSRPTHSDRNRVRPPEVFVDVCDVVTGWDGAAPRAPPRPALWTRGRYWSVGLFSGLWGHA